MEHSESLPYFDGLILILLIRFYQKSNFGGAKINKIFVGSSTSFFKNVLILNYKRTTHRSYDGASGSDKS